MPCAEVSLTTTTEIGMSAQSSCTLPRQADDGKMLVAGALIEPLDGGILIFKDCTKEVCPQ